MIPSPLGEIGPRPFLVRGFGCRRGGPLRPATLSEAGVFGFLSEKGNRERSARSVHEMSIAQEICRITREQVGEEGCPRVVSVGIEVGPFSGVEPDHLVFWLEIMLAEAPFAGASPVIHAAEGDVLRVGYLEVKDDPGPA
jgi:hypothetical protein